MKQSITIIAFHYKPLQKFDRSRGSNDTEKQEDDLFLARAFAELTCYIESSVLDGNFIYKLSQLHGLFENRLSDLGVAKSINKTRHKKQLLEHFCGECQEQHDGKNVLLVFNEGLKKLLKESMSYEAISMVKLVKVIRQEILEWGLFDFSGTFQMHCQANSVPNTLKMLISMLLNGPNVQHQDISDKGY